MRSEVVRGAEHHTASLPHCGRLSCSSGQLALAGQPPARRWPDVRRGPGGQLLGGHCCSLFCRVSVQICFLLTIITSLIFIKRLRLFFLLSLLLYRSDLCSSRSESYWTAVVGEFDITKTDPDEQVLKVNRIIPHPKVTIWYLYLIVLCCLLYLTCLVKQSSSQVGLQVI